MPNDKAPAINTDKIVAALDKLAATPNENRISLKDRLKEPRVYEAIKKAKMQKRTLAEIADAMKEAGIEIKAGTLGLYLREIENEAEGGSDAKASAKPKTTKARTAAAKSEASEEKPKATEGKRLNTAPSMGGAFNDSEL